MEEIRKNLIIGLVCDYYGICIEDVKNSYSPGKLGRKTTPKHDALCARYIIVYLLNTRCYLSFREIEPILSIKWSTLAKSSVTLKKIRHHESLEMDCDILLKLYNDLNRGATMEYAKSFGYA